MEAKKIRRINRPTVSGPLSGGDHVEVVGPVSSLLAGVYGGSKFANQNRTIAIASGLRVDGAKSSEILQKEEL